ncbi:MAG: hypothetical protein OZ929_16105, partial [Bryobacterales bacterium]|nr:hypothetical protein [Bryobacterales bacterium]
RGSGGAQILLLRCRQTGAEICAKAEVKIPLLPSFGRSIILPCVTDCNMEKNNTMRGSGNGGYTTCPFVTGYGKVLMAEFGYDKKPALQYLSSTPSMNIGPDGS